MVLLRGLNYDFSGQPKTFIATAIAATGTTLTVDNTEGFLDDDYIVIESSFELAEIVKITTVDSNTQLTIGATKFAHVVNVKIFRLPFNQMKFYECEKETGTYAEIASSTVDLDYSGNYTIYDDVTGDNSYYFKRTFYNSNTSVESDIALAIPWLTNDEKFYITPIEVKNLLMFGENDWPKLNQLRNILKLTHKLVNLQVETSNIDILIIANYLLAKVYVMKGLASRSISKGYVTFEAEGRKVTKAYQECILDAENCDNEYKLFINALTRSEVSSTNFMNTANIDADTRQQYIDILNGTQNAMDYDAISKVSYSRCSR